MIALDFLKGGGSRNFPLKVQSLPSTDHFKFNKTLISSLISKLGAGPYGCPSSHEEEKKDEEVLQVERS